MIGFFYCACDSVSVNLAGEFAGYQLPTCIAACLTIGIPGAYMELRFYL
jgi:hypothetical protein